MQALVQDEIVEVVVQFIEWYKGAVRVEFHTDLSLKRLNERMKT